MKLMILIALGLFMIGCKSNSTRDAEIESDTYIPWWYKYTIGESNEKL